MRADTPLRLALSLVALGFLDGGDIRLVKRKLGDIAVIGLPRGIKDEMYKGIRTDQANRVTFTFGTAYFWASFGSGTAYRQLIFVSVMAPDATEAEYAAMPVHFRLSYDRREDVHRSALGSGNLTIGQALYRQNSLQEPSWVFTYADRARRLQIVWHAVKSEVSLEDGVAAIGGMAESFRILSEPTATFADMRDRPNRDAAERERKRSMAREMLAREGFRDLVPGTPGRRNGVSVEWMADPEPRFQILLPLGRVKVMPDVSAGLRPRPAAVRNPDGSAMQLAGSVGWYEYWDDDWRFSNNDNAYLPLPGIAAILSQDRDPSYMVFYYSATVRVEESNDDRLKDLAWFWTDLPLVQRLWREGKLITGAIAEAPFPLPSRDRRGPAW